MRAGRLESLHEDARRRRRQRRWRWCQRERGGRYSADDDIDDDKLRLASLIGSLFLAAGGVMLTEPEADDCQ
jgi:hypothetical protein